MSDASLSPLVFAWSQFGPYHMDRCEALGQALAGRRKVIGLELVSQGEVYDWAPSGEGGAFQKLTLFPGKRDSQVPAWRHLMALLGACLRSRARHVFLCDFQLPPIFLAACLLRLLGRRVIVMQDSKFDDKQRSMWRELGKAVLYRPYNAAFVGGRRSKSYLEFLGMPAERVVTGYDTVSMERLVRLAGTDGPAHAERHFTVIARFVPEKNLELALDAYAAYRQRCSGPPRELLLCGAGPLEDALKRRIAEGGIDGVRFCGWLDEERVARVLASSLALILPSTEEPFGLVVNEAIALGVPVLVSENCGARDLLVRSGVDGYVIEPDNAPGLARFMERLARDEAEWQRLSANTRRFRTAADTAAFVAGVEELLQRLERR
ncbi:MAG TPA: glycosyltransferase family 4 protein [Stellaceae bacterium]|nr:glycosyltransferase family 4 protein [Stellaceae bacterium]